MGNFYLWSSATICLHKELAANGTKGNHSRTAAPSIYNSLLPLYQVLAGAQLVSNSAHGVNQAFAKSIVNLAAQVIHINIDHVG